MKLMKMQRPMWIRIAVVLSGIWTALIFGLVTNAIWRAPTFEAAANMPCSQFLLPIARPVEQALQRMDSRLFFPFVRWQDTRSGETITPFRRGEQGLHCDTIEARAKLFLIAARTGSILPQVSVHRRSLAALVGLPCCMFIMSCYLLFGRRSSVEMNPRSPAI